MGLRSALRLVDSLEADRPTVMPDVVAAIDTRYPMHGTVYYGLDILDTPIVREQALKSPSVVRARNLICSTIGGLPLRTYNEITRERVADSPLLYQPDPGSPKAVTYAYLVDSLMFYGTAYAQVVSVYAEDNRPREMRWVSPTRVTVQTNMNGYMITGYMLDGAPVPSQGKDSLIAFPAPSDSLLATASRTVRTALELEAAAYRAATEPIPQTVLKNTGVDLPADKITDLLAKWKVARQSKATAYLTAGIEMEAVGFDPRSQQLVEARQFAAQEIARAFNMDPFWLGASDSSMTYSNRVDMRRDLIDFTLRPYLSAIEDRLSMPDITPRGQIVRFDFDDFLRGNAVERADVLTKLLAAGVIDVAEARAMEDLAPRGNTA